MNITVAKARAARPPSRRCTGSRSPPPPRSSRPPGSRTDPQPSAAGDDWVVIRQDPAPGTAHEVGKPVTLAVENRASTAGAPRSPRVSAERPGSPVPPVDAATGATGTAGAADRGTAGADARTGASPSGATGAAPTIPVDAAPAADDAASAAATPTPSPTARVSTATAKLPRDLVFAGATSGQLYRLDGRRQAGRPPDLGQALPRDADPDR